MIIPKSGVEEFNEHITLQNSHIKFTRELEKDGHLAVLLDTCISRNPDGSLDISVQETHPPPHPHPHTDQYLHFDSHHPVAHKLGVLRTLVHRAEIAATNPQEREKRSSTYSYLFGTRCG